MIHRHLGLGSLALALLAANSAACKRLVAADLGSAQPQPFGASPRDSGLCFLENRGQWACDARFVAVLPELLVRAEQSALGLQLFDRPGDPNRGTFLRLRFVDASPGCVLMPEVQGSAVHSWFLGSNPARWSEGQRGFAKLRWHGLYEGIDLVLHEDAGTVKYDLEVAPGADLSRVLIQCEGAESVEVDTQGFLVLTTSSGCMSQPPIRAFAVPANGGLRTHECRYRKLDAFTFGFEGGGREESEALWIDPALVWSTFLGGGPSTQGTYDVGWDVSTDAAGDVYVAGQAAGATFPVTPGAYNYPSGAGSDCFAAKFRGADGQLVYSCVFGGSHHQERSRAVRADSSGCAVVGGWTFSEDFPTTPGAYDTTKIPILSASFVLKLSASGEQLLWSTFVQGDTAPSLEDLELDSNDAPVFVGSATTGYPTTPGAFQVNEHGGGDAFVTKLSPQGTDIIWSTYLGGNNTDEGMEIAIDHLDYVIVAGRTGSTDYPTTPGVYSSALISGVWPIDLFVTRMSPDGHSLIWSTYIGGSAQDFIGGLALVPDGSVIFAGSTFSYDFPVTLGAVDPTPPGSYVTRLAPDGASLVGSTYFGTSETAVYAVTADGSGVLTCVAAAFAGIMTTPGAFDTTPNGNGDVVLVRLSPTASKAYYVSYFGGAGDDVPYGIACMQSGSAVITGHTFSPNLPMTVGAHDTTYNGGVDCFVSRFEPFLAGVEPYGRSTPGCRGALVANATAQPQAGAAGFGLYLSGAPSFSRGLCLVSTAPSLVGTPYFNATLWLNVGSIVRRIPVATDAVGFAETPLPLGSGTLGQQLWVQYVMLNEPGCPGTGRLSASNALQITVQ